MWWHIGIYILMGLWIADAISLNTTGNIKNSLLTKIISKWSLGLAFGLILALSQSVLSFPAFTVWVIGYWLCVVGITIVVEWLLKDSDV